MRPITEQKLAARAGGGILRAGVELDRTCPLALQALAFKWLCLKSKTSEVNLILFLFSPI